MFLAFVSEGNKHKNKRQRQWLVLKKSLFYTSRFLACSSNLQQIMKKKIRIKRHQSGYFLHPVAPKSLINQSTVGKRSGACQVLDTILARRLGATLGSTLTLFAHATNEQPSISTVLWKESKCRKHSQCKHNKKITLTHLNSAH